MLCLGVDALLKTRQAGEVRGQRGLGFVFLATECRATVEAGEVDLLTRLHAQKVPKSALLALPNHCPLQAWHARARYAGGHKSYNEPGSGAASARR